MGVQEDFVGPPPTKDVENPQVEVFSGVLPANEPLPNRHFWPACLSTFFCHGLGLGATLLFWNSKNGKVGAATGFTLHALKTCVLACVLAFVAAHYALPHEFSSAEVWSEDQCRSLRGTWRARELHFPHTNHRTLEQATSVDRNAIKFGSFKPHVPTRKELKQTYEEKREEVEERVEEAKSKAKHGSFSRGDKEKWAERAKEKYEEKKEKYEEKKEEWSGEKYEEKKEKYEEEKEEREEEWESRGKSVEREEKRLEKEAGPESAHERGEEAKEQWAEAKEKHGEKWAEQKEAWQRWEEEKKEEWRRRGHEEADETHADRMHVEAEMKKMKAEWEEYRATHHGDVAPTREDWAAWVDSYKQRRADGVKTTDEAVGGGEEVVTGEELERPTELPDPTADEGPAHMHSRGHHNGGHHVEMMRSLIHAKMSHYCDCPPMATRVPEDGAVRCRNSTRFFVILGSVFFAVFLMSLGVLSYVVRSKEQPVQVVVAQTGIAA